MGSVFLADGTELKLVSGVDDHSRFCVIAEVVARATGRTVCQAFVTTLLAYGCPEQVLTDNGRQFTGKYGRPRPAEVLFDRICHDRSDRTGREGLRTGRRPMNALCGRCRSTAVPGPQGHHRTDTHQQASAFQDRRYRRLPAGPDAGAASRVPSACQY